MPVPELDPEQRRDALAKATEARRARAEVKQMLKTGEVTLTELLGRAEHVETLARMRVSEVLESLPRTGKKRARDLMAELDIDPGRRLRGLGRQQRAKLLEKFGERTA